MLLLRCREGDFYMGEGRGEQLDCAASTLVQQHVQDWHSVWISVHVGKEDAGIPIDYPVGFRHRGAAELPAQEARILISRALRP